MGSDRLSTILATFFARSPLSGLDWKPTSLFSTFSGIISTLLIPLSNVIRAIMLLSELLLKLPKAKFPRL